MGKKELGALIATMRRSRGISQSQLADMIGRKQNSISSYESGRREPDVDTLEALADAFNVPLSSLMEFSSFDADGQKKSNKRLQVVPILGDIAAGQPIIANPVYDELITVPTDGHIYDAAVRVKGDSMIPMYMPNDIVFIKYTDDVDNGDIAAVGLDDEVTLKRVYHLPNGIQLLSENRKYAPMTFTNDDYSNIHLIGKAVAFLRWQG